MAVRKTTKRLYLIPVLSKALDILELLQAENQPMTLESIHRQTRISKTTVYRVLKTFVHRGYLSQQAVQLLFDRILYGDKRQPERIMLPGELVRRHSCGCRRVDSGS